MNLGYLSNFSQASLLIQLLSQDLNQVCVTPAWKYLVHEDAHLTTQVYFQKKGKDEGI